MMKVNSLQLGAVNPAVSIAFLRRIGAPQWRLLSGATERVFSEKTQDKMVAWISDMQRDGHPVFALLPRHEEDHWWLTASLPLTAAPATLRPAPQIVVGADRFECLLRLAQPVTTERAHELVFGIIGKAGKASIGEPIPLPGTILSKRSNIGLPRRYPVRQFNTSPSPGYQLTDGRLVDVRQTSAPKADPRLMTVRLAENAAWQPGGQSNGFMIVLGGSGSGKTFSVRVAAGGLQRYGVPVVLVDFHGDMSVPGVSDVLLSGGPASTIGLNPLEIDMLSARETGLDDQRRAVVNLFSRAVKSFGHRQAATLLEGLQEAYARAGIYDDDESTWGRPPPTFTQLVQVLEEWREDKRVGADSLLDIARAVFSHKVFNRAEHLPIEDLLSKSVRLNLSKLPEDVRIIAAETVLKSIFRALMARGPIPDAPVDDSERFRAVVILDEARIFTSGGGRTLDVIFCEARKFGLGAVVATQRADHLSADIRGNAASWLVLRPQNEAEAKAVAPDIGVDSEQLLRLKGKGDGYFRQGSHAAQRIQVQPPK
jgi:hypothetical protein